MQYESGVYVLSGTHEGDTVVKVGRTTSGVYKRVAQLNKDVYAGVDDWHCVCWYEESNVRLVNAFEKMAHDELERFQLLLPNGTGGIAREVFDIHWEEAVEIINEMLGSKDGSVRFRPEQYEDGDAVDLRRHPKSASLPAAEKSTGVETARKLKLIYTIIVLSLALIGIANIPV